MEFALGVRLSLAEFGLRMSKHDDAYASKISLFSNLKSRFSSKKHTKTAKDMPRDVKALPSLIIIDQSHWLEKSGRAVNMSSAQEVGLNTGLKEVFFWAIMTGFPGDY